MREIVKQILITCCSDCPYIELFLNKFWCKKKGDYIQFGNLRPIDDDCPLDNML
jgi:hypothetical protein